MNCYEHALTGVAVTAIGVCVDCGVSVCAEHSELIEGTRDVRTGKMLETRKAQARWFVCLFDAASRARSDAARAV